MAAKRTTGPRKVTAKRVSGKSGRSAPTSAAKTKAKAPPKAKAAPRATAAKAPPLVETKPRAKPQAKRAKAAIVAKPAAVTKASLPNTRSKHSTPKVERSPARRTKAPVEPVEMAEPAAPAVVGEPAGELDPVSTAKLALGPEADARAPLKDIPWSYGHDRVTAAAVDPDRMFAYWEVTDPAIERARSALGRGGPGAWLAVRVYDTTGLIFDGTNAHSYFDHDVDRATRQWFFQIGKPTSTAVVELGMKSTEGYFVKIARSGRVEFPRREPAPWGDPEWMTVQPWSGEVADVHRSPAPPPGPGAGPGAGTGGAAGGGVQRGPDALPLWTLRDPVAVHEVVLRHLLEAGWERVEWTEAGGEGWFALEGRVEWESPRVLTSWEAGPFTYPVEIEPPRRETWEGKGYAYRAGSVVHVVEGPWRVVIRNLHARSERELLGSWEIRRSWSVHGGREVRVGEGKFSLRTGASEQLPIGASERWWLSGSETRLGGASERWRIGASEVAYRGASERLYAGGSQLAYRGASERMYSGGSETRLGGASERAFTGGSETRLGSSDLHFEGGAASPFPYPATGPATASGKKE
jgi:hypothetical protein